MMPYRMRAPYDATEFLSEKETRALVSAQSPGTTDEKTLSSFDPGANVANRWNVAFANAMAAMAVSPFVLVVDDVYTFTQKVTYTTKVLLKGYPGVQMRWAVSGDSGIHVPALAAGSTWSDLDFFGPGAFSGSDDAIFIEGTRCIGSNLGFSQWGRNGLRMIGDVGALGTNVNECLFAKAEFTLCGNGTQDGTNAGIYLKGGDANGSSFVACDAADCRRGFYDSSFLGNYFAGGSVEGCNDRFTKNPGDPTIGYGYIVDGLNARTTLVGCYMESDSESDVNNPAMIFGGVCFNRGACTTMVGGDASFYRNVWMPDVVKYGNAEKHEAWYASIAAANATGRTWVVGDRLNITEPASGQPSTYRCTVGGVIPTWTVESTLA